jgi:hypothetical protein
VLVLTAISTSISVGSLALLVLAKAKRHRIGDVFNTACFIGGIRVKPRAVAALFSLVYKDAVQKWDSPYDNVPVTDSDRDRILNNIREAFRFHGFGIDVIMT